MPLRASSKYFSGWFTLMRYENSAHFNMRVAARKERIYKKW
jgi:hypothetical protein